MRKRKKNQGVAKTAMCERKTTIIYCEPMSEKLVELDQGELRSPVQIGGEMKNLLKKWRVLEV